MPQKQQQNHQSGVARSIRKRTRERGTSQDTSPEPETPVKRHQPESQTILSEQQSVLNGTPSSVPSSNNAAISTQEPAIPAPPKLRPRPPPIERQHYRAAVDNLEKMLKNRSLPCTPRSAHEGKDEKAGHWCSCKEGENGLEKVICDDPDCQIIWYHKECLRKEVRDLLGRYRLWLCSSCFFKRKRGYERKMRENAAQKQKTGPPSPQGPAGNESVRNHDSPAAAPPSKAVCSAAARVPVDQQRPKQTSRPEDTYPTVPPIKITQPAHAPTKEGVRQQQPKQTNHRDSSWPTVPPIKTIPLSHVSEDSFVPAPIGAQKEIVSTEKFHGTDEHRKQASAQTQSSGEPSDEQYDELNETGVKPGAEVAGSKVQETQYNGHSRDMDKQQQASADSDSNQQTQSSTQPQPASGEQRRVATEQNATSSVATNDLQRAQTRMRPFRATAEERCANIIRDDPELNRWAFGVSRREKITESARMWTFEESYCDSRPGARDGSIVIYYKHGQEIPAAVAPPELSEAAVQIKCCYEDNFYTWTIVEVPTRLLMNFSPWLHRYDISNRSKLFNAAPGSINGTIDVGRIDHGVVESAIGFLKGEFLEITLPSDTAHISYAQKLALVQMTDLAHKLSLECLQQAAMHAICVSILRSPKDWDNEQTRVLIKMATWEGNPVRDLDRLLEMIMPDNIHRLPMLPCEEVDRRDICAMSDVTFGEDGQMQLDPGYLV